MQAEGWLVRSAPEAAWPNDPWRPEARFVTVEAVVSAQDPTLNPDHLVAALHQLAPELAPDFAAFTRQEVYTEDMQIFR